jgi:Lon protease-like protein
MAPDELLPLFPLEVVLLPGNHLPLHIFEERYRQMIGAVIAQKSEFGVILTSEGKIMPLGCTATVEAVTQRFEDGRFNIDTVGRRRFRTLQVDESLPFLRASVSFFDDEPQDPADPAVVSRVAELAQEVGSYVRANVPSEQELSPLQPSFQIAGALPLDRAFKQKLLSQTTEPQRLSELENHLSRLLEKLRQAQRAQQLAGHNGFSVR